MEKKDSWGLTEEEIKERLRKLNQEKKIQGPTRGGRSSGQGRVFEGVDCLQCSIRQTVDHVSGEDVGAIHVLLCKNISIAID